MQFITNCPACQTQFVVTEEQLNQHNGKVRCGHCLNVFNASEQLVNTDANLENNATAINMATAIEPDSIQSVSVDTNFVITQEPTSESTMSLRSLPAMQ